MYYMQRPFLQKNRVYVSGLLFTSGVYSNRNKIHFLHHFIPNFGSHSIHVNGSMQSPWVFSCHRLHLAHAVAIPIPRMFQKPLEKSTLGYKITEI